MVPDKLREEWNRLNTIVSNNEEDYESIEEFDSKFGQYSLGGGITHITFENPIK